MKKTITRKELYQYEQDILQLQKDNPVVALLLEPRIKFFIERVQMHLKIMHGRFNQIKEKYVAKDPQGNFLTEIINNNKEWKLIHSKIDLEKAKVLDVSQVRDAFNEECEKFFSQSITLDL